MADTGAIWSDPFRDWDRVYGRRGVALLREAPPVPSAPHVRVSPADLADDTPLTALGLDSLAAVELRNAVAESLGVEVDIAGHAVSDADMRQAMRVNPEALPTDSELIHAVPISFTPSVPPIFSVAYARSSFSDSSLSPPM